MKRVLVLGGTGMLGAPVAHRLAEDGFEVRALSRHPAQARARLGPTAEIEIVRGDATDRHDVRAAVARCDIVHVSMGPPGERVCVELAVRAATEVGAERIGYVSGTTVAEEHRWFPMIEEKLGSEAFVRGSAVPWTIFRPSWPFEQLPRFARGGKPFLLGDIPHAWHWFAADDMGRMVSASYRSPEAANRTFFVHGPEALTLRAALERYCATVHPDAPPIHVTKLWLARTIGVLTRNAQLRFAAALMAYFTKVGEGGDPTKTDRILGAPTTTLDAWLRELSAASSRTGPPATGSAV
jgi:uncharacterized protein YbjT (DUF2867 family)